MCNSRTSDSDEALTDWSEENTRRRFIAKVCVILTLQFAFTSFIAAIFVFVEPCNKFLEEHIYLCIIAIVVCFVIELIIYCIRSVARTSPINYCLLIIFTFCKSIVVSGVCINYHPNEILLALGLTTVICVSLLGFALFMPCDFTGCGPFLCILFIIFMGLTIAIIFIKSRVLVWIFLGFGLVLFSFFLIFHIQLLVGKHKNRYSEKDYIIAALDLYLDVIYIFLFLLQIIGLLDA